MKPEKPKIIRRKPAGSDNDEQRKPKPVVRKSAAGTREETARPKPVSRKPAGEHTEDSKKPRSVYRKSEGENREDQKKPRSIYRKPAGDDKEEQKKPRTIYRKSAGDDNEEQKKPRTIYRKSAGDDNEEQKKPRTIFRKSAGEERKPYAKSVSARRKSEDGDKEEMTRLNKYIANSGMCSRREADKMIEAGIVSVNGKMVTELGTKVGPSDKVKYADQIINKERPRYLLLNKPKGFITTTDDPENRRTVMALVSGACKERIYPVGRLDRNTTGLLLFTNDGNIAKKLSHPRYGIKKIYHVEIGKPLTKADFDKIATGFKLEDEFVEVDAIEYIGDGKDKKQIGIELHSGKNRVVRRIFEHFEYEVVKLDRVYYAGLTKKNLPRGTWRFLDEKEVNMLKMISTKSMV